MKILINAISCKMGGAKVIINSFIRNIPNDGNEYHFLVYPGSIETNVIELNNNIFIHENNIGDKNHVLRFLWDQIKLPKYIKKNNFEYMINMTNYGPIFPGCKQILLLHNSKHISKEMWDNFSKKDKIKLLIEDMILKLSLSGTYKLVVQTEYMKKGIISKFKFDKERIIVIPNSAKEKTMCTINEELEEKLNRIIKDSDIVLSYISLYSKHKNFEKLIDSVEYLKFTTNINLKLIITLDKSEGDGAINILKSIEQRKLSDYVFSTGNLKNENIHQILTKSNALIFPSYAESFGMPFVEAMSYGLPILASDIGFAHDVCGDAAIYFKYNDVKDITEKIVLFFENSSLRESLKRSSEVRFCKYEEKSIVNKYLNLCE